MTRTKTGHWRDSPENGTPHDRDMDRDIGGVWYVVPTPPVPSGRVTIPAGCRLRIVPWPGYDERTLEPWFTVNVRGPSGSFWPQHNGRRFARGKELARMERKHPGLADAVSTELTRRLGAERGPR